MNEFNTSFKAEAFRIIVKIIEKHKEKKRVYLCVDSIGKEDLMVDLSQYFSTLVSKKHTQFEFISTQIVVSEERYRNTFLMGFPIERFSTNTEEGFIEVITKPERKQKIANDPDAITITTAAWANIKDSATRDVKNYVTLLLCPT